MTTPELLTNSTSPLSPVPPQGLAPLCENHYVTLKLEERKGNDGAKKLVLRGEFGWADKATENKRKYPSNLLLREFKKLKAAMSERRMYGELDHPQDARTMLQRVSHIITNLELTPEGIVVGEAEVLPTERGKVLEALLRAGCKVGVSSRGFGTTKMNESGEEEVQEDFQLVTYDVVADPAASTAYPDLFYEWKAKEQKKMSGNVTPEVQARIDAAVQDATGKLKAEFAEKLSSSLAEMKAQAREEARSELMTDPQVAGAKLALDRIREAIRPFVLGEDAETVVKAKDAELDALRAELAAKAAELTQVQEELGKMAVVAKEAGYKFFMERHLANDPDAELIRKVVGDVKAYESADALKTKIEGVRSEIARRRAEESKAREAAEAKEAEARAKIEELEKKNAVLSEGLKKSLSIAKKMALSSYAESKFTRSSQKERARSMVESSGAKTQSEVDELLSSLEDHDPEVKNESTRARIRRLSGSGTSTTALDEERSTARHGGGPDGYNGLDAELDELRQLSGMANG